MTLSTLFTPLFFAQQQQPADGGGFLFIITMVLFMAGFWFLLVAPQRKKQKLHQQMLSELKIGDEIVTVGGIYGTVTNIKEDRFTVRIAEGTKVELAKGFVQTRVPGRDSGA